MASPLLHLVVFPFPVFFCTVRMIMMILMILTREIWQWSTDSAATRAWESFSWATSSLLLRCLSTAWRCLVHLTHQVKENLREVRVRKGFNRNKNVRNLHNSFAFNTQKCGKTQTTEKWMKQIQKWFTWEIGQEPKTRNQKNKRPQTTKLTDTGDEQSACWLWG